jgi:ubiquinone/menaquinone biosynthesis C-methylase UbiE
MNVNHGVANRFDLIENYDLEIPIHIAEYLNRIKTTKSLNVLNKYFSRGDINGLDLGCGTGEYIRTLESIRFSFRIDGLDYSEKQIRLAKKKGASNLFIHASMCKIPVDSTY